MSQLPPFLAKASRLVTGSLSPMAHVVFYLMYLLWSPRQVNLSVRPLRADFLSLQFYSFPGHIPL